MMLTMLISSSSMLNFGTGDDILLFIVKAMFILAGFLYFLFAFLVTRQISVMSRTVSTTASPANKTLGYVHLVASVLVLIYFLIVL